MLFSTVKPCASSKFGFTWTTTTAVQNHAGSMKRKTNVSDQAKSPAKKVAKTDEFGEYLKKDVYGTKVSVQTESDKFKVAERVGKMRARNSGIVSASDHEMKKQWSSSWTTGYIKTIGIRRSTGPPAPRRMPLVTPQPSKHDISE